MERHMVTIDGNTAAANVAYGCSEVVAIYPITPSSPMGEIADALSAEGKPNIYGTVPSVTEMQSEAGAAGAVHGALTSGALTTTFTASQGLLLMIPNMYKIAGELTPTVFHVTARALATHALSIFGDQSDVMATRQTGFALLCSNSVQEVGDLALIAHAATLASRVPFLHFFDGFRTSHEVQKVEELSYDDMRAMIDDALVAEHRARGLNPERPVMRGTAQNPDVFFQGRETVNPYYDATPAIVQQYMDRFAKVVGRQYHLFDYVGAPDAERVVVMMGSGAEAMHEVVEHLVAQGEKVGLIKVRLYRPFSTEHFVRALPATVKAIAVLDRTKEPGAQGEPLYTDVRSALSEAMMDGTLPCAALPRVVGGRYGLGSKDFTGAMAKAVLDNLAAAQPKNHFTVGITEDVTGSSLPVDEAFSSEPAGVHRAVFFGLGSDGTVGANKNSIKIIGKATANYAQGYFYYDSKKSNGLTVSHLRFGKTPIRSTYLVSKASFVACHNWAFTEQYDVLSYAEPGATFLLNSPYGKDEVWAHLPRKVQEQIIAKKLRFFVVDAVSLAQEIGLGGRINTTMQTAFFLISGILPKEQALELIKVAVEDTYGDKGQKVVEMNYRAVDAAVQRIEEVQVPAVATSDISMRLPVPADAPEFVQKVTGEMIAFRGDQIPTSAFPVDGTYPTATSQYEKRNVAVQIPVWDPDTCTQCGQCSLVCSHAAIRMKAYDPALLADAPATWKSADAKGRELAGLKFTLQVAPEDCTACGACVYNCPARKKDASGQRTEQHAIEMADQAPLRAAEAENYRFFLGLPETDPARFDRTTVKGSQLLRPMFEYSGACGGCGETPYLKLLTQLFGDRAMMANATGCSSIYGGNLPTTPYCQRGDGRGPVWSNSLFEDAAEFGLGMRLATDRQTTYARELLDKVAACGCDACTGAQPLFAAIKDADQRTQPGVEAQRARVAELKALLERCDAPEAKQLLTVADFLIKRSVWIIGGDGWAYDIGYGGLDHVIAQGKNVNILVLDTEVYSNTGGQMSKSTPRGAVAQFAAAGKPLGKKDLGMMAMTYGNVYVARVAMGASPAQTLKAFVEAESYDGPSLIIAYSHCIMHGIDTTTGMGEQKKAVESGYWPLFRFDPRLLAQGKNPLQFDSRPPKIALEEYAYGENRYRQLKRSKPEVAAKLMEEAKRDVALRFKLYQQLAGLDFALPEEPEP
ncbi:MAG TPA: pyruvate:ferredoxin (flavodoxin) oxidoreductase [Anaerolineae bacterium]|nr:pyruvate:ferredoxin (flavodoxin) oxidoreductase [Anaerolineae bacterium]